MMWEEQSVPFTPVAGPIFETKNPVFLMNSDENLSLNQNRRKWPELLGVRANKVREVVVAQGRLCRGRTRSVVEFCPAF